MNNYSLICVVNGLVLSENVPIIKNVRTLDQLGFESTIKTGYVGVILDENQDRFDIELGSEDSHRVVARCFGVSIDREFAKNARIKWAKIIEAEQKGEAAKFSNLCRELENEVATHFGACLYGRQGNFFFCVGKPRFVMKDY